MVGEGEVLSGFLVKSPPLNANGRSVKRWKKRWCVLRQDRVLEYYEDKKAKAPKGRISLDDCETLESGLCIRGKPVFDLVTPKRTFYFCAPTKDEEESWVHALCKQLNFQLEPVDSPPTQSQTLDAQTAKISPKRDSVRRESAPVSWKRQSSSSEDKPDKQSEVCCENQPKDKEPLPNVCTLTSNFTPVNGDCFLNSHSESGISLDGDEQDVCTDNVRAVPNGLDADGEKTNEVLASYDVVDTPVKPTSESMPISIPGATPYGRQRPVQMSPEDEGVSTSTSPPPLPNKSPSYQRAELEGYATLTADDIKPPIDRSKKPRCSREVPVDPDAPPIDRSRKPSGPLNVSVTIPIEGTEFVQVPEATSSIKRFSRVTYYALPAGSVTPVPIPASSLPAGVYSVPAPMLSRSSSNSSLRRHDSVPPQMHYDYPPTHHPSSNYDYPPPPRSAHYDYPPKMGQPILQRSMSTNSTSSTSFSRQGCEQNYSYPPHPIPVGSAPVQPNVAGRQQLFRTSLDSRSSVGSHASRGSHGTMAFDDNDGGDYLFTPLEEETEQSYEYMAAGVMAGNRGAPARPPKPSL